MSDNRYCTKCGGRMRRKVFRDEIGRIAHGDMYYCENCRAQATHCASCSSKDKEIDRLKKLAANMEAGFHEAIAAKDAEIERLQNIIIGQINSLRRHAATVGDRYSDEAMALQHLLRGER